MQDKILGILYGMAIGDAMGMPPELWSRNRIKKKYGEIRTFLDGDPENEISYQYKRGNFTDDTAQALIILDSLIETHFIPSSQNIAEHLLEWAKKEHAFENNILGPSSKAALELFSQGKDTRSYSDKALSNGAAMRIPPIGALFPSDKKTDLCRYAAAVSSATHTSDIAIAGAAMIATAVSSVLDKQNREEMIKDVLSVEEYALSLGASTVTASIGTRIRYGIELAKKYSHNSELFLEELYSLMGAGVNTVDSVPCAVVIAYYSFGDVLKTALLCTNLGGDTDTIGAMATAISGGVCGYRNIPQDAVAVIDEANHIDFTTYAHEIEKERKKNE